jgi:hypothetical protein
VEIARKATHAYAANPYQVNSFYVV